MVLLHGKRSRDPPHRRPAEEKIFSPVLDPDDPFQPAFIGPARLPVTVGTVGDMLRFTGRFDGWGYVRLFDYSAGKMTELDTYAIPEAHDQDYVRGFGDLSVHEVATSQVRDDLAYLSYYSGGFRVLKITDDEKFAEVGHFIDVGGSNFWGVEVFQSGGVEYVAASDRDSGLYIFRYTGSE